MANSTFITCITCYPLVSLSKVFVNVLTFNYVFIPTAQGITVLLREVVSTRLLILALVLGVILLSLGLFLISTSEGLSIDVTYPAFIKLLRRWCN